MRRGDIYTAAARGAYSGKPRPVVIIHDDRFDATASVTVVPFTTSQQTGAVGAPWNVKIRRWSPVVLTMGVAGPLSVFVVVVPAKTLVP